MMRRILFSLRDPRQPKKETMKTKTPNTITPAAIVVELKPGTPLDIAYPPNAISKIPVSMKMTFKIKVMYLTNFIPENLKLAIFFVP